MERRGPLMPAPMSSFEARRVCIIKPSALGDVTQSLPVLAAVKERYPRAKVSWVINAGFASLLRPIPLIDEVIEFDRTGMGKAGIAGIVPFGRLLRTLRRRKFDLAIDLQGLLRTGLMAWATGADRRIGLASAREGSSFFYTDIVHDLPIEQGAVDRYWKVAEHLGVGHLPKQFPLSLTETERHGARQLIAGAPRPWVAVAPGAKWQTKRWPPEHFADTLAAALAGNGRGRGTVLLLAGPDETTLTAAIAEKLRPTGLIVRDLAGKLNLRQLAATLEASDLAMGNDSGPMHVAAAVGTPTVTLFTCTSPQRAAPYHSSDGPAQGQIIQTTVACRSSYIKCCDRMDCMKDLTSDKALPILQDALRECQSDDAGGARASAA